MLRAIRIVEGTKISHDSWETGETFSYEDLLKRRIPAIGIPAAANNLLIVDVDAGGKVHKYDGRADWKEFAEQAGIPKTYTVKTPSDGYHFYFRLPDTINKATFSPRKEIFKGVDIVYNGYVLAPPTGGYASIHGDYSDIAVAPIALLRQVLTRPVDVDDLIGVNEDPSIQDIHTPLSTTQVARLKRQMEWIQLNAILSYDQWFRGLVSLKAGIHDAEVLEECALMWTRNQSYQEGDDQKALDILRSMDRHGGIGPGTIFEIVKEICGESKDDIPISLLTKKEVIEAAGVQVSISKQGLPVVNPNESNIASIIAVIPQFSVEHLYYDTRIDSYLFNDEQIDDQTLVDIITPLLQSPVKGLGFENFRRQNVSSAVQILMTNRRVDPHMKWLEELKWDGVSRIKQFFPRYLMTDDNEYTQTLGQNLWTALAARGLDPGCKMDNIVIIEGLEGVRKSTLIEAIGGKYYMSLSNDEKLNSAEALRKMHQSIIVEIPELLNLINREGEAVKAILTTSKDRLRGLYAKKAFDRKRGFIFVGTTNSGEYLIESMGERRYWPVKIPNSVEGIDVGGVKVDRAQLFAEGVHRYRSGASYWTMPKMLWVDEITSRKVKDPLAQVVEDMLKSAAIMGVQTNWRIDELYEVLHRRELITKGLTKKVSDRIGAILRSIGAEYITINVGGDKAKRWVLRSSEVDDLI